MEIKQTGEYSFVQYLVDKKLYVDNCTLMEITRVPNKTEMFRLVKKLGSNLEYIKYQNRKLYPTDSAIKFFELYREHVL
jgi:hypothetical protein